MVKFSVAALSAVLICTSCLAQVNQKRCGTFDVMKYLEEKEPGYLNRVNAAFDNARRLAEANRNSRGISDTIYHIQLVFHVVYTAPEENIPDSVIYSQVDVLNEDYRRLNADTVKTRDIFKDIAADAGIDFHLATVDPDGNPTNGITRTHGSPTGFLGFEPFTDNVKRASSGGVDAWPTDRYLNVWVCNILGGLGVLGYSFPPDSAPNWPTGSNTDSMHQGVVLHYPAVGRNFHAPIDSTVAKGRSCTHEIGHYLGLRHIWGDGDCTADDGLDDTPDANAAHQQTCDTTSNTCPDSPTDFPDMIENYMDYSDDRCLNMFTMEQVGIMRAMLQTARAGVATVSVVTKVEKVENNFDLIDVFPNPSSGLVNLNAQVRNGRVYSYAFYNAMGQKLIEANDLSSYVNHRVIDFSNQPSGIYFAKISSGQQVVVKKFQVLR
jgi:hypothetical protein